MKTKAFVLLLMAGLGAGVTGCIHTANDENQIGVPFLADSAEGTYERSMPDVLQAARDVIKEVGVLRKDNTVNNSLEARINDTTVYIRVEEKDPAKPESHVVVQARTTGGAADVNLAHEVEKRIALKLVRVN